MFINFVYLMTTGLEVERVSLTKLNKMHLYIMFYDQYSLALIPESCYKIS